MNDKFVAIRGKGLMQMYEALNGKVVNPPVFGDLDQEEYDKFLQDFRAKKVVDPDLIKYWSEYKYVGLAKNVVYYGMELSMNYSIVLSFMKRFVAKMEEDPSMLQTELDTLRNVIEVTKKYEENNPDQTPQS